MQLEGVGVVGSSLPKMSSFFGTDVPSLPKLRLILSDRRPHVSHNTEHLVPFHQLTNIQCCWVGIYRLGTLLGLVIYTNDLISLQLQNPPLAQELAEVLLNPDSSLTARVGMLARKRTLSGVLTFENADMSLGLLRVVAMAKLPGKRTSPLLKLMADEINALRTIFSRAALLNFRSKPLGVLFDECVLLVCSLTYADCSQDRQLDEFFRSQLSKNLDAVCHQRRLSADLMELLIRF
eukprot:TRINITY_DN12643_c0_g1_i1.p2 TRINITY_DN12643_c0_g1~~TRINITY_DN12643_c0_g1_i1.p2  ORF type:complete len:236 (+),score=9.54 TRINITY_DN12643_c0_g1_i1:888-1595(+)